MPNEKEQNHFLGRYLNHILTGRHDALGQLRFQPKVWLGHRPVRRIMATESELNNDRASGNTSRSAKKDKIHEKANCGNQYDTGWFL